MLVGPSHTLSGEPDRQKVRREAPQALAGSVSHTKQTQEELKMKTQDFIRLVCGMTITAAFAPPAPADPSAEAGKAIYDNSCIHCHGEAGVGNPVQEMFWHVTIPKLNGDYVQKKSDDQLRAVILNGVRKMPPAVQGQPHSTTGLKVKPEQVPDLIAYIRTLKKK